MKNRTRPKKLKSEKDPELIAVDSGERVNFTEFVDEVFDFVKNEKKKKRN